MPLPSPLPDDPRKWDGWRNFDSDNFYERLCLTLHDNPPPQVIEENCRQLLVWWQKKLPLKNQPSNPLTGLLRSGLDQAPRFLTQARATLLDPEARARIDGILLSQLKESATDEFKKFLAFSLAEGVLRERAEQRLMQIAAEHQLSEVEAVHLIERELERVKVVRERDLPANEAGETDRGDATPDTAAGRFLHLLDLSGLENGIMTDDQRDAFVNMAENLGIDSGDAEDMIDGWIEVQELALVSPPAPKTVQVSPPPPAVLPPAGVATVFDPMSELAAKVSTAGPAGASSPAPMRTKKLADMPPLNPAVEKRQFLPFSNSVGMQMGFVPSGVFIMGAAQPGAPPHEQPPHEVRLSRYYIGVIPVTHGIYEQFDPHHHTRRPVSARLDHPVVYVSSLEAMKFCEWLSRKEGRHYRLPTEAEWEYAARGSDGRQFPWGNYAGLPHLANFADKNTSFAWSDPRIDDGFAETSPVGYYPAGVSPFGLLDMAGNVWEWCSDFFDSYRSGLKLNPTGPPKGNKRIFRGGSWRSRFTSLRTTARNFNSVDYSFNDLGFRVVCEA